MKFQRPWDSSACRNRSSNAIELDENVDVPTPELLATESAGAVQATKPQTHKNGLPNALAEDPQLGPVAVLLGAYRASIGSTFSLNKTDCRKRFGIGERSFDDGIAALKREGWMARTQPRKGFRRQYAKDRLVIKPGGRPGYTICKVDDFAWFEDINSQPEKREAAKAFGVLFWMRAQAPGVRVSTTRVSWRFVWTGKTATKHLEWLASRRLINELQRARNEPRVFTAHGATTAQINEVGNIEGALFEGTQVRNSGGAHLDYGTETNNTPTLKPIEDPSTHSTSECNPVEEFDPFEWLYNTRHGEYGRANYIFDYILSTIQCDHENPDENGTAKWIADWWENSKTILRLRKATRNRINTRLLSPKGLEGMRFLIALVAHSSAPVAVTYAEAFEFIMRTIDSRIGTHAEKPWLNCWSLIAMDIGRNCIDGSADISPTFNLKRQIYDCDPGQFVLKSALFVDMAKGDKPLQKILAKFSSPESFLSWVPAIIDHCRLVGKSIKTWKQLDAAFAQVIREAGHDTYHATL